MRQILSELSIRTSGQGFTNITEALNQWIYNQKISRGILIIFVKHTSCSLTINENADPKVLNDLSKYMQALVPEEGFRPLSGAGELKNYLHSQEGPDDMPAHIRSTLTSTSISLSIDNGILVLGIWQAIYLWEHRVQHNSRKIHLHAIGELAS